MPPAMAKAARRSGHWPLRRRSVSPGLGEDHPPIQPLPCFDADHQSDFGNADPGAACALLPLMTLRPPRIDCSRSRNSSVTAPASTLLRMSRVLMKMMISDRDLVLEVFPNRSPRNLISRRPGMPDRVF